MKRAVLYLRVSTIDQTTGRVPSLAYLGLAVGAMAVSATLVLRGRKELGNFIGQNELVQKIPADGYDRFRADPEAKPGQVYQTRTRNDQAGFPADRRYWESLVPVLTWEGRELRRLELLPISLGWKDARHRRGRPRLAATDEGRSILERFAGLSQPFGTTIDVAAAQAAL